MKKEDKLVLGTLAGVDLILSPEHYEEYKGTLQDQLEEAYKEIERLQNMINELEQKNQELKLELLGYRQAILKDKEMLGLKEENQKYKDVIDKAILYINSTKYSDITGLEKHSIKEFWFIEELEKVLKEVE